MHSRDFQPVIGAKTYRAIQSVLGAIMNSLEMDESRFLLLYKPRLTQIGIGDHGDENFRNLVVDAAIYVRLKGYEIGSKPLAVVCFDPSQNKYRYAISKMLELGIVSIFSDLDSALRQPENLIPSGALESDLKDALKNPFTHGEQFVLSHTLAAIERFGQASNCMVTGQVSLGEICNFDGFEGREFKSQTDVDLLICTKPPVCFPILAIEIDGPSHYSQEFYKDELNPKRSFERARRKHQKKAEMLARTEISVLHIRVNKNSRNIFQAYGSEIGKIISKTLQTIEAMGHTQQRKKKWIDSCRKELGEKIMNLSSNGDNALDPQLETAFIVYSDLVDQLTKERDYWRDSCLKEMYEKTFKPISVSLPGSSKHYTEQLKNELILSDFAEGSDASFMRHIKFDCDYVVSSGNSEDEGVKELVVFISVRTGSVRTYEIHRFSELVPSMYIRGPEWDQLDFDLMLHFAQFIGERYIKGLSKKKRDALFQKAKSLIEAIHDGISLENKSAAVKKALGSGGKEALKERLFEICRKAIVQALLTTREISFSPEHPESFLLRANEVYGKSRLRKMPRLKDAVSVMQEVLDSSVIENVKNSVNQACYHELTAMDMADTPEVIVREWLAEQKKILSQF